MWAATITDMHGDTIRLHNLSWDEVTQLANIIRKNLGPDAFSYHSI